jgi:hypothetical protein
VRLAAKFELFFVNSLGMAFNTGVIVYALFVIAVIATLLWFSQKKGWGLVNFVTLAFLYVLIGYSTFAMIVIRSSANPPMDENNPENFIDKRLGDIPAGYYRPKNDARCDLLMAHSEGLEHDIFSLATALQPEHAHKFHFVVYQDLITNPAETMEGVYEFLAIPKHNHNFQNLRWVKMPNEDAVFGIPSMHKVNSKIKPSDTNISILSDYVKEKYQNALDFLSPVVKL